MIQTCIRSEKLEHYNYHRSRLIDLCAKSDELLKKPNAPRSATRPTAHRLIN